MIMFNGSHPLWNPANFRLLMLLGAMFLILWWNASNFDDTEITAIIQLFMAAIGIEGIAKGLGNRSTRETK